MRKRVPFELEQHRIRYGDYASAKEHGFNGAFMFLSPNKKDALRIICSSAIAGSDGWEHVSVSVDGRCPTWEEMHVVKRLCWDEEETVVQFHPPASVYVNNHPFCLHLWRDVVHGHRLPPPSAVGIQSLGTLDEKLARDFVEGSVIKEEDYCPECGGPCLRRPRHGDGMNI